LKTVVVESSLADKPNSSSLIENFLDSLTGIGGGELIPARAASGAPDSRKNFPHQPPPSHCNTTPMANTASLSRRKVAGAVLRTKALLSLPLAPTIAGSKPGPRINCEGVGVYYAATALKVSFVAAKLWLSPQRNSAGQAAMFLSEARRCWLSR
jgi:hypothetical protein